jgi:hypothetical protein
MDHGVAQHIVAGVLHSLCYKQLRGTPQNNMKVLWTRMQELYKSAGIAEKLSRFTLKMFTDPDAPHADFPKLTNAIKATTWREAIVRTDVLLATLLVPQYRFLSMGRDSVAAV